MFLDDKLFEIGRRDISSEKETIEAIREMLQTCLNDITEKTSRNSDMRSIKSAFNRVHLTWKMVAETLEKENKGIVRPEGFKDFVKSKPEFDGIFN